MTKYYEYRGRGSQDGIDNPEVNDHPAFVVAGDYPDKSWEKALAQYEAEGGKVVRVTPQLLADKVGEGNGRASEGGESGESSEGDGAFERQEG